MTFLSFTADAQEGAKPSSALHAIVGDVTDNRTTGAFNSECKVEIKFTGDAAADAADVHQVHVTKAVDETGRDLVPKDKSEHFSNFGFHNHQNGALRTEIALRNPSRNASVIKVVEAQVELFSPTSANGGILTIKDILKHPAEPVQDATLKKYNVELMYLTKETYAAKKKQLEEQKDPSNAVGQAFGEMFKGMFGGMMSSDSANSVMLYIKDPDNRVVDFELQDANGKPLKTHESWSMSGMHNIGLVSPAPADAQLLVHLATPEATQSFPFKLENVPLP